MMSREMLKRLHQEFSNIGTSPVALIANKDDLAHFRYANFLFDEICKFKCFSIKMIKSEVLHTGKNIVQDHRAAICYILSQR